MNKIQVESWLRLLSLEWRLNRVKPLLDSFSDIAEIFDASENQLKAVGLSANDINALLKTPKPTQTNIELILDGKIKLLPFNHPNYPSGLNVLDDPPAGVFVRGDILEQDRFGIGIVGTRKPSQYGLHTAERYARELASNGFTIVSGGATGIDTSAHSAAIDVGGRTIAILGTGVDVVYPPTNSSLFNKIAQNGVLLSQFPLETKGDYWRFPVRNHTITALSQAVVVIEAPESSGSLITARYADELSKPVFVVPGSIESPNYKGSHGLIKDGLLLTDSPSDILSYFDVEPSKKQQLKIDFDDLTETQKKIVAFLTLEPTVSDRIASELGLTVSQISIDLTLLEMKNLVRKLPGGSYSRKLS